MSYIDDHPTQWNWTPRVALRRRLIQLRNPWMTYTNTYYDHPPGYGKWPVNHYTDLSIDIWQGGRNRRGKYTGYRGKPLRKRRGDRIFRSLFYAKRGPQIDWIIWQGRMWWNPQTGGPGWTSAPSGPPDSDPGHYNHIHVTYIRNT